MSETALRIGEVAKLVGLPAKTLRYYEELGLISPSRQENSGYRVFGWREMEQIEFVKRAKLMGLSLEQIRTLVEAAEDGVRSGVLHRLEDMLDEKLSETERKLVELRAFRESLLEYRGLVAVAEEESLCRCSELGATEFCGCVSAATEGVTPPVMRVVEENGLPKRSVGEPCRCGCCDPTPGRVS
ncbi:MerR family DNA-binding transcriptional regulator [Rubrobacter indicoceani]|uniref:MerR family DNA-binding transcriptional regulator n=1 Tax=Rubrobacter indicoceani TaxID=2051957 RepID=UPI000E5B1C57|nr:MerR family transcriptional regulator [Rubrobacter indicoceani]